MARKNDTKDKLVYSVSEAISLCGIKRTQLYKEINQGRLKIKKCGRRTLIMAEDIEKWLKHLPEA